MSINRFKLVLFAVSFCVFTNAQEIDDSLIKNLTPEQIQAVKSELEIDNKPISDPDPIITESTNKEAFSDADNDNPFQKFGYDFFSTVPTTISPLGDLPIPNDYKISLKDQFTVILSGSKENIFDLTVNLDGTILFPEIGSISVVGETFNDVKEKLRNLIDQSYIGVNIDLSIKNLAAKKVTIVGAVNTPGTYLINPFSTISSALAYSGGISELGTLRDIKLMRNNGDIHTFDLYKLLINGDRSDDVTIEAGDVILVGPAVKFIPLLGEVRRPAIYEMKQGESLNDIIRFGLGFTDLANKSNINLKVYDVDSFTITNMTAENMSSSLTNVIGVDVFKYINKNLTSIKVDGSVKEPGFYKIDQNTTLKDLIDNLEFVDVYPWLAVLEQFDDNNLMQSSVLFNLNDPETYDSIKLLPNSRVYFADIFDRLFDVNNLTKQKIDDYSLTLNHRGSSYIFPVYGIYKVKSFVDLLGLDMSDVNNEATYISPLESIVIKDNYKNMQFIAKKYNTVSFRSPINDLIEVTIEGEVDYPGKYILESDATLQDLYALVGKFKKEAYTDGVILTRESIRQRQLAAIETSKEQLNEAILVSVQKGSNIGDINIIRALADSIEPANLGRIAGDFSPGSYSALNSVLFDGDRIIVPRNPNVINVLGEVLNPIAFEYDKKLKVKSAIMQAGGYKENAKRSSVYVIKANGLTEKVNRNIFVKNISLAPGDTIVVPRRIYTNSPGLELLTPITQILSDLAFSAAALDTLSDNN